MKSSALVWQYISPEEEAASSYSARDRPQLRVKCTQLDSKGEETTKACHQHLPGASVRVLGS